MNTANCVVLVPCSGAIERECEHGLRGLEALGYQVRRVFGFSAIDFGRSVLASHALQEGFDELMWIDSDIGFDPRDVERLRSHNLPFTCALYPKKDRKTFACNFLAGVRDVTFGAQGRLTEMLHVGFGFAHTRKVVFDSIREKYRLKDCNHRFGTPIQPWFIPEVVPDGASFWYLAEDYAFCHRASQCGIKILADTAIRLSHVGKYPFTWDDIRSTQDKVKSLKVPVDPRPDPTPNDIDEGFGDSARTNFPSQVDGR